MAVELSVIVPALNEAANLPALAERLDRALSGRSYELLIVDDNSRDDTQAVCAALTRRFPLGLFVRTRPTNGLSGAVLYGLAEAQGEFVVVMDADLQHPPEQVPDVLGPVERDEADFVIGSRYVAGGSIEGRWSLYRKINSRVATLLAWPFAGRVSDPMSGFFAMRRSSYEHARRLTPLGYKIALELLCKSGVKRVAEVPIHFAQRTAGESKLSLKQQFKYLEHLSRLYDFTFPRLSPFLKFSLVTLWCGLLSGASFAALRMIDLSPVTAAWVGYLSAIAGTAVFHARYVRTQREFIHRPRPWRDFWLCSIAEIAVVTTVAAYLVYRVRSRHDAEVWLISFVAGLFARYVLRKELLLDIRGLRYELRKDEWT